MIRPFYIFPALLLAVFTAGAAKAEEFAVSECGRNQAPTFRLMPLKPGPLTLAKVYCLTRPSGTHPARPSPDRNNVFVYDESGGLFLSRMSASSATHHFHGLVRTQRNLPFAWSGSSQSVFGVRQETIKPSGWALGPLKPVRFRIDGSQEKLTELTSPAGPLDEIHWIGHAGLAIAEFGTRGQYYRPEHADLNPTMAFVDARAGRVLQSITIADVQGLNVKPVILGIASALDRRGNPFALMALPSKTSVLWVQGQQPRLVPIKLQTTTLMSPYALSRDGKSVLVLEGLSATGMICERNPKCPAPTPQTGRIAGLHALPSGKLLWSLEGTAKTFANRDVPAISPDGRFALISMPSRTIALLSMKNGSILQEIPKLATCAMGFSDDGRSIWISGGSFLAFYNLKP